ncbi:MAG: HEPN domain-containing protein [Acidobacteria bacterium]|nr:HEPN domain-containing protein [Acidobacteriota bacterium]
MKLGSMLDIAKQVEHWRQSAEEDWAVAVDLVRDGRSRHGLFFAHLALEKLLKALVCRRTREMAPKIHNLVRLAEVAELRPSPEQSDVLADMNAFHLEGRYPESLTPEPTQEEAQTYLGGAEEVYRWLTSLC